MSKNFTYNYKKCSLFQFIIIGGDFNLVLDQDLDIMNCNYNRNLIIETDNEMFKFTVGDQIFFR